MNRSLDRKNFTITNVFIAIIALGLVFGAFFLGYNKGKQDTNGILTSTVTNPQSDYYKLEGVYRRSYYNNYNVSVDSYIVLREDMTCDYIDSIKTELSSSLDFANRTGDECAYLYDNNEKTGKIKRGEKSDMTFAFDNGVLTVGGSTYSKIQAAF